MSEETELDSNIEDSATTEVVRDKLADAYFNPGLDIDLTPEEAELAGAFVEEALSVADAMESVIDLPTAQ
jgi:hypothetical protein